MLLITCLKALYLNPYGQTQDPQEQARMSTIILKDIRDRYSDIQSVKRIRNTKN